VDKHLPSPQTVRMVSGKLTTVQTAAEAEFYVESQAAYLSQTKFTENTDLKDLDRLLVLELMVFRWQQHLFSGQDYDGEFSQRQAADRGHQGVLRPDQQAQGLDGPGEEGPRRGNRARTTSPAGSAI
jgi:hypothetical protein